MANSEEVQPSESVLWSPDTKWVATTGGNEVCVMKLKHLKKATNNDNYKLGCVVGSGGQRCIKCRLHLPW